MRILEQSPERLTSTVPNEYDPDTQAPSNVELDFGFTGKFTDELTGLTHHQHRWLDPQLGKWINEDPIGLFAGDINTTRYVANDPLIYVDSNGLFASGMGAFGGFNGDAGDGIVAHKDYTFLLLELRILVDRPNNNKTIVVPPNVGHVSVELVDHWGFTTERYGMWPGGFRAEQEHENPWDIGLSIWLTERQFEDAQCYLRTCGNEDFSYGDSTPFDPSDGSNCATFLCQFAYDNQLGREIFPRRTPTEIVQVPFSAPRRAVTPEAIGASFEGNPNVIYPQ